MWRSRLPAVRDRLRDGITPACRAAAAVFGAPSARTGACLLLALCLMPRAALFGVVGALAAAGLARLIGWPNARIADGSLTYNALLSALAVAWLTRAGPLSPPAIGVLLAGAVAASLLLSAALAELTARTLALPPLSLAFTLVFGSLITLFPDWAAIASLAPAVPLWSLPGLPEPLLGFLRAAGTIFFMRDAAAGLLVILALGAWSPLGLACAVAGYAGGMGFTQVIGAAGVLFHADAAAHNFLLAGLFIGAIQFVPSRLSLVLGFCAGACAALAAALLQRALAGSGWEYLPLPFILTDWTLLAALRLRVADGVPHAVDRAYPTPEQAWRTQARDNARFPELNRPHLLVPSSGLLKITQGFDGALSHRGDWRFALDFEACDATDGPATTGRSDDLRAFPSFGMAVESPGSGVVQTVVDGVPDNPPGACDFARNWGNFIVLKLDTGALVTLAHLRCGSVRVAPGAPVFAGQVLGECGNSGRSPVPHLHLQVQAGPSPGAPTLPFRMANYIEHGADGPRWMASGIPAAGVRVSAARFDPQILKCLSQMAPGVATFHVAGDAGLLHRHRQEDTALVRCELDAAGRHVLTESGGRLLASAGLSAWNVLDCEPGHSLFLWLLALGMPRAPYASVPAMVWRDRVDWPSPLLAAPRRRIDDVLGTFAGWRSTATRSGYVHGAPDGGVRIRTEPASAVSDADLPFAIEVDLLPVRGVVGLSARFRDGMVRFRQDSFFVGQDSSRP
jgi:hypothetical protein